MSGRRVCFSFHFDGDIWRASNVRTPGALDAIARVGFSDGSLRESKEE
jgi:hypothetical protein